MLTTIHSLGDRYRGVVGRRDILFMNEQDLRERGLEHGDCVDIETALDLPMGLRMRNITAVSYDIARGSVAVGQHRHWRYRASRYAFAKM